MNRRIASFFLLLLAGQVLAQEEYTFDKPDIVTKTSKIELKPSTVFIPIVIKESVIKKAITNATPDSLELHDNTETSEYHFLFKLKDGASALSSNSLKHTLRFLDGSGYYKKRTATNKPWPYNGTIYSPWATVNCSGITGSADVSISFVLQPNYQIKASGDIQAKIENISCANINITSLTRTFGWNTIKEDITKSIDRELKKFDLKKHVQSIWNELQTPFKVNDHFYVITKPTSIAYSDIIVKDGKIQMGIGLTFDASTGTPEEAKNVRVTSHLPDMQKLDKIPTNQFDINLPVHLPYDYLDKLAKELINGYEITATNEKGKTKKYGKIQEIEISGSKEDKYDIVIGLQTTLYRTIFKKKQVPLYLHAKLGYDNATKQIIVTHYKVDAKTENGLYNLSLKAIANKLAYKKLISALRFNVEDNIETQRLAINSYLGSSFELTKGVQLSGLVNNITLTDIIAQPKHVTCLFSLQGNVKIEVLELGF